MSTLSINRTNESTDEVHQDAIVHGDDVAKSSTTRAEHASRDGLPVQEASYIKPSPEQLFPPPHFKPFYTLIEDADTGDVHHPTVHYIFSDDDPDLLTSAALEAIEPGERHGGEAEERFVLIDVGRGGRTVESVASLSPDWYVLRTELSQAPSWAGEGRGVERGLMLKLSGKETSGESSTGDNREKREGLDELVRTFGTRLEALEEMLGEEESQRVELELAAPEGQSQV